tara:strand:- start:27 stop:263 length:237 start_codon:yes stop_codon:yes gene_type:complete
MSQEAPNTPVNQRIQASLTTPPPAPQRPTVEAVLEMQRDEVASLIHDLRVYLEAVVGGGAPGDAGGLLDRLGRVFPAE